MFNPFKYLKWRFEIDLMMTFSMSLIAEDSYVTGGDPLVTHITGCTAVFFAAHFFYALRHRNDVSNNVSTTTTNHWPFWSLSKDNKAANVSAAAPNHAKVFSK